MNALQKLRERLGQINEEIRGINATAEREERAVLTEDEEARYGELRTEREQAEARIAQLEEEERRREADAAARRQTGNEPAAVVTSEPQVYGRGSGNSYFLDVARVQLGHNSRAAALGRLERHAAELEVEIPRREEARARRAQEQIDGITAAERRAGVRVSDGFFEKRVNPNRTDGQGGYFVPPLWLIDEYIPYLRNGRPFANQVRGMDLPAGTDSINLPKVATGTKTGVQQDNGSVTSQDLTDDFVSAPVRTIAGQQDVAMQLLDQSPIAFDEIVFADLLDDYAQQCDVQCITGSGASGQLKGIDNVTGTNAVTYTDASPSVHALYTPLAQALSQLQRNRKRKDGIKFFMQGPRWWWIASSLDSQNRPLVPPSGAWNPLALMGAEDGDGPDGTVLGRPVYTDLNITETDGAGTNQDRVYAVRTQDLYLWEGTPRTRAMTEVLSGTLQVRLQVYNYVAFMPDRYASATSVITGTGLIVPTGF